MCAGQAWHNWSSFSVRKSADWNLIQVFDVGLSIVDFPAKTVFNWIWQAICGRIEHWMSPAPLEIPFPRQLTIDKHLKIWHDCCSKRLCGIFSAGASHNMAINISSLSRVAIYLRVSCYHLAMMPLNRKVRYFHFSWIDWSLFLDVLWNCSHQFRIVCCTDSMNVSWKIPRSW